MKTCPLCKQRTLERRQMGPGQGDGWVCTNPDCAEHDNFMNYDIDDDED
jgi:hypothetical protein